MNVALIRGRWHSIWESLACGYLRSFTEGMEGIDEYRFFDGYFETDEDIIRGAMDSDIVGFSATTSQGPWCTRIAKRLKEENPGIKTAIGGYGPSVDPGSFLNQGIHKGGDHPPPLWDWIIVGEGEVPWRAILADKAEPGIVMRQAIPDLDSIPFPDRDFIKVERCIQVAKKEEGRRVTGILGNRGCLRRCKFCADGTPKTIYGVKLRERSPGNILDEMAQVGSIHGIEFFKFADPEVNTRPGRNRELAAEMVRRKWEVPWGGNMLVNPFDERDAQALYAAGCREVWFGLESGSPEILKHIGKGITVGLTKKAFKAAHDAGIMRRAYVLMGTPLETPETIKMTETLIDEVRPDTVSFSILAPYPGTEYYRPEFASWDWEHVDEYGGDSNQYHNLGLTAMTRPELLAARLRLIEKYRGHLSRIMTKKIAIGVIDTGEIDMTGWRGDQ